MSLRVAVVNDYPLVVEGTRALLQTFRDRVEVVDASEVGVTRVDVVLFDTFASPVDWETRCASLALDPLIGAVVVFSFVTDPLAVEEAFEAGVAGYLSKSLPAVDLVAGIERAAAGQHVRPSGQGSETGHFGRWPADEAGLSPRESEMLALIVQGRSNEEIAAACYLSINTVKSYIRDAYRKIGVSTRPQAVAWALRNGVESAP